MERNVYRTREGTKSYYNRFSEEDVKKADRVSILDWVKQQGYPIKEKGNVIKIKGQGGLSIDKYHNRWYCHSNKKGGGPIQLVTYLKNVDWADAVEELIGEERSFQIITQRPVIREPSKDTFVLPEKNRDNKHVYAYLTKTRMIHPDIVKEFVEKKLLYENIKKSCVFVGCTKEGNAKYANIRSTNTIGDPFKGDAASSDKRFGFARVGSNHVLTVMEAPIDLLSYMSIFRLHNKSHIIEKDHLLSLGGVSDNALIQYLEDHPEITKIRLGLDNDIVGNEACEKIFKQYSGKYQVERIGIREKDFNETLIKDVKKFQMIRIKQLQRECIPEREEEQEPV